MGQVMPSASRRDQFEVDADLVGDALLLVSDEGQVRRGNRRAVELLGPVEGVPLSRLVDEDAETVRRELARLAASGRPSPVRLTPRCHEGHGLELRGQRHAGPGDGLLLRLRDGSTPGALVIERTAREIRRRRRVEERLHHLLSTTMSELEESNQRLRDSASSLAHDLRNPLASIRALAESVAQTERLGPEPADYLARIVASAEACDRLIRDTLTDAERRTSARAEDIDLRQELTWLRSVVGDPALELHDSTPMPVVRGARNAVRQVLLNLVVNAVKHRGAQPRVRVWITATPVADGWQVSVSDDGPGIPEPLRAAAFRPGERLGASVTGSGRGLGQVREAVERAGGRTWASESPYGGLSVHVVLPAATGA
ncbi:sensor histidine kinase [Nocardioides donggukensis]|uniref:Sensor-like histidine kinase SenX3 n=1 Tax=Nocardioides donggukensis TaxID=2774019 RepID=A0A927Q1U2_9ACTN|nr:HAMP domain-containing sensor histidine kinase [Nocardioides donggukensis]MBD8869056.1 HAMP domain-containing histidine kinase [Nocardioides donggukensis]